MIRVKEVKKSGLEVRISDGSWPDQQKQLYAHLDLLRFEQRPLQTG